ncbi:MAG: enoyl-ACP reductase [Armatimonadetes bacterium]|nr:enoyl-ACP reductase [Armatimonadota bacterium]
MLLDGKKGLVLNVVNKNSIGWAIAEAAVSHGAKVGVGAQNDRLLEAVEKLTGDNPAYKNFVVDFTDDAQLEALAEAVKKEYGTIDFVVHSAAYAPKEDLQGRFIETSRNGFQIAMDISAYSLIGLCRVLEPLINDGGSVMALSYLGSTRAAMNYNVMGVAKAALESSVRYLASDLGKRDIRVNTLSPGPINTVAARGVKDLTKMIDHVMEVGLLQTPFGQAEVGGSAVYLMSDLSKGVTGQIIFIDNGYNVAAL